MSETPPVVEQDDVHLRWMREAMHMVRTHPILRSVGDLRTNTGGRGNDSQGSPSRLHIRPRQQNHRKSTQQNQRTTKRTVYPSPPNPPNTKSQLLTPQNRRRDTQN